MNGNDTRGLAKPVAEVETINPMNFRATVRWYPECGGTPPKSFDKIGAKLYTNPQPAVPYDATQEMCIAGMQEWDVAIREGVREWPEMMRRVYKAMLAERPDTPENT